MIKKQQKLILILFAVVVLLAAAYLIARPFLAAEQETDPAQYDADGDLLGLGGRPFVFPSLDKQEVQSIAVTNAQGSFTLYRDPATSELVFKGAEMALYDETKLSDLYVQACYMLAIEKIHNAQQNLSLYGLGPDDHPVTVEVTDMDGNVNLIYIGDKLVTGGAYYAKHADKPYIYAITSDIESALFADVRDYLVPQLALPVSQTEYNYVEDFKLYKNGELFVECEYIDEQTRAETGETNVHRMLFPANYVPSNNNFYAILETFMDFSGDRVVEYNVTERADYEQLMASYGFGSPAYEVRYSYSGNERRVLIGNAVDGAEEESYYAYSPFTDLIAVLPLSKAPYLKWELIDFVDRNIFQRNINDISTIQVVTDTMDQTFTLKGEGQDIVITDANRDKVLDTKNFRQYYMVLLSMTMQDYADQTEDLPLVLTLRITTDAGKTTEYQFFSLSTRRCFYTVDGQGEFYLSRDSVDKIISDTLRVVNGETVDAGLV